MHEYSLVRALLDRVEETARSHGASSVARVELRVGTQSGVEIDLLKAAFELVRAGTLCSEAELVVEAIAVTWECPGCGESLPTGSILSCPRCDRPARMTGGGEIVLQRLEMEVP